MKKITILFIFFLTIGATAFAKKDKYESAKITGNTPSSGTSPWTAASVLSSEIPGFDFANNPYKIKEVKSYIQLKLDTEHIPTVLAFTASVPVKITYFLSNATFTTPIVENKILTIDYNPTTGAKYKNIDLLLVQNAWKIQVEYNANAITTTGATMSSAIKNFVSLQSFTEIERYYNFNNIFQIGLVAGEIWVEHIAMQYNATHNELTLSWESLNGVEGYELEYTFIDDYTDNTSIFIPQNQLKFSFRNNSTRILIQKNEYTMPIVQEHGYLVFRVRGYGMAGNDFTRLYFGPFDYDAGNTNPNGIFTVNSFPHKYKIDTQTHTQDKINWQSVATFAEEGKSKTVVKYMDGTMRARQIVTSISTDHNAVVAETIYDFQGRPAANMLPAPVPFSAALKYYSNFNQNMAGQPYSYKDFDLNVGSCEPMAVNPVKQDYANGFNKGAGNYYSQFNPVQTDFNAFIPEAKGYPFALSKFMPDPTDRVFRQGGVGDIFQPGKTNTVVQDHDTKFFYGKPVQEELDRLFGTNVGYAQHYQKNMVVDANGQVAVSYVDLDGKTIASALAGLSPANLKPLDSYASNALNANLLTTNTPDAINNSLISSEAFTVVDNNTPYQFHYQLDSLGYNALSCNGSTYCLDCIYDVEVTVVNDACAKVEYSKTTTIGRLDNLNFSCKDANASLKLDFNLSLNRGSYTVTKKLLVNQQAALAYATDVLNDPTNNCLKTYQDFLNEEMVNRDTTRCMEACAACQVEANALGNQVAGAMRSCDSLWCNPQLTTLCDVARISMINDLSPEGQYALCYTENRQFDLSISPISIFNLSGNSNIKHINDNTVSSISVSILGATYPLSHYTNNADSLKKLIQYWPANLSEQLLPLHPEYCYLQFCGTMTASNQFDTKMMNARSFADAQAAGLVGSVDTFCEQDHFYTNVLTGSLKTQFKAKFDNYDGQGHSIKAIALFFTNCPSGNNINNCTGASWANGVNDNEEWEMFRNIYYALKQEFIQKAREKFVQNQGCKTNNYIGCANRDCSISIWGNLAASNLAIRPLYDNAIIRFPTINDVKFPNADTLKTQSIYDMSLAQASDFMNTNTQGGICPTCPEMEAFKMMVFYINEKGWAAKPTNVIADNVAGLGTELRNRLGISIKNSKVAIANTRNGITITTAGCTLTMKPDTTVDWNKMIIPTCLEIVDYQHARLHIMVNGAYKTILNITASCDFFYCLGTAPQAPPTNKNCQCDTEYDIRKMYQVGDIVRYNGKCYVGINVTKLGVIPAGAAPGGPRLWAALCDTTAVCKNPFEINFSNATVFTSDLLPTTVANPSDGKYKLLSSYNLGTSTLTFASPVMMAFTSQSSRILVAKNTSIQPNTNYRIAFDIAYWGANSQSIAQLKINGIVVGSYSPAHDTWQNFTLDWNSGSNTTATVAIVTGTQNHKMVSIDNFKMLCNGNAPIANGSSGKDSTKTRYIPANVCGCNALCDIPLPSPTLAYTPCDSLMRDIAEDRAARNYEFYRDSVFHAVLAGYNAHCLNAAEQFSMNYTIAEYHYTLYYYDQSGNLVRTVPPAGVKPLTSSQLPAVTTARNSLASFVPSHVLPSTYRHNALNGVVWLSTPDAGESAYFYDQLGRITMSQNAKQKADQYAAYTRYDSLSRNVEVGKVKAPTGTNLKTEARNINSYAATNTRTEITHSYYDQPASPTISNAFGTQKYLRNRIGTVAHFANNTKQTAFDYDHASHYNYDIAGNVTDLLQDFGKDSPFGSGNVSYQSKRLGYDFDLVSGKVNQVHYQAGYPDQFTHRYTYDADNRIVNVHTSTDNLIWENDARYRYYRHGPLARTELGTDHVQGIDHIHNLQGWIKGVNGFAANPNQDAGKDGDLSPTANGVGYLGANKNTAPDVFAYWLNYYQNDYQAIAQAQPYIAQTTNPLNTAQSTTTAKPLYNGNIRAMYTYLQPFGGQSMQYEYDQLNRIKTQKAYSFVGYADSPTASDAFGMTLSYDANGNIKNLLRNGNTSTPDMDKLAYAYYPNTNRLAYVKDAVAASSYPHDIDGQPANNYTYDAIGNLSTDASEGLAIAWNIQNKVTTVSKTDGTLIAYNYDALGNRVEKTITAPKGEQTGLFYVRDAQGSTLAVYELSVDKKLRHTEQHLFGSGRLGMYHPDRPMQRYDENNGPIGIMDTGNIASKKTYLSLHSSTRNNTQYELTNHLGNVLATISDSRQTTTATLLSTTDYYAFGMEIKERSFALNGAFRYGYNGKENDKDWGTGLIQDYGFRLYNPAIARFLSVDPITKDYPELTPYQFASNKPINSIDLDGKLPFPSYIFILSLEIDMTGLKHYFQNQKLITYDKYLSDQITNLQKGSDKIIKSQNASLKTSDNISIVTNLEIIEKTKEVLQTITVTFSKEAIENSESSIQSMKGIKVDLGYNHNNENSENDKNKFKDTEKTQENKSTNNISINAGLLYELMEAVKNNNNDRSTTSTVITVNVISASVAYDYEIFNQSDKLIANGNIQSKTKVTYYEIKKIEPKQPKQKKVLGKPKASNKKRCPCN